MGQGATLVSKQKGGREGGREGEPVGPDEGYASW